MTRTTAILALALASAPAARADRISLRGGGDITGVVVEDPAHPDAVVVQTEGSAKPLVFSKDQVLKVTREPGPLDDYLAHRDEIDATAQAQHDFGLWCEENKLAGPAQVHFRKAVEIDPQFAPAQRKLGHVQQGDRWVTYDQQREAQGLIRHKGRWISQAEKEKLDAQATLSSEQSSWASRIKLIRSKLYGKDEVQREQAETQIGAIRDPAAVPGLVRAFSADGDAMRIRLAGILAAIEGPEATEAIVSLVLAERDPDVRRSVMDELAGRRDPDATTKFLAVLGRNDPEAVGRAAWALATSRTVTAVPRLVEALTQSEKRMVLAPVAEPSGGGIGGSFSFGQGLSGGPGLPSDVSPGFAVIQSQPILTGVAVAPGAVAYGAASVPFPYGAGPVGVAAPRPMRSLPRRITVVHQNPEVLRALESLTGVNFGFDKVAWRKWVGTSFHPEAAPPRRVPQP